MTFVRRVLQSNSGRCGPCLFPLVALFEEVDADLVAIDPSQLAAPVGQSGGRQQQKKFLEVQALDRALDGELGAGLGDVLHRALAPPGPVDSHHMGRYPALEDDAIAFASFGARCHASSLPTRIFAASSGRDY